MYKSRRLRPCCRRARSKTFKSRSSRMNRYPQWKYLVIAVAMLFGLIYALPNFFGESPAVQVSPLRGMTKVDQGLMKQVEEALKTNNLPYQGVTFDSSGVK